MMTQLLGFFLGKIKQPRVIAEILGGILLGNLKELVRWDALTLRSRSHCARTSPWLHATHLPLGLDPISNPHRGDRTLPFPFYHWP